MEAPNRYPYLCPKALTPDPRQRPRRHLHQGDEGTQSQFSAPPVWYSVTRVSKKLRSFYVGFTQIPRIDATSW